MLRYNNYVMATSLQEAYELNQKRSNVLLGGTAWLKMGKKQRQTAIDMSELGLDKIEENEEEFQIGAMVTLRDLEQNESLMQYTSNAIKESVKHIVGTQFRNCATVGGSIYGRFGFSDVLTFFLALDTYVELYKEGIVPLEEYAKRSTYDRDIIVKLIVKKQKVKVAYQSFRNQSTDFPVLTVAVSWTEEKKKTVVGARPAKAAAIQDPKGLLLGLENMGQEEQKAAVKAYASYVAECFDYADNMRSSGEYRKMIARVLISRAWMELLNL